MADDGCIDNRAATDEKNESINRGSLIDNYSIDFDLFQTYFRHHDVTGIDEIWKQYNEIACK